MELTAAYLGNGLWLSSLLDIVSSDTLSLDTLSFCILFVIVIAEQVDLVVVFRLIGLGGSSVLGASNELFASSARSGERSVLSSVGSDVSEPSGYAGILGSIGGTSDSFENKHIGLRGFVSEIRDIGQFSGLFLIESQSFRRLGKV